MGPLLRRHRSTNVGTAVGSAQHPDLPNGKEGMGWNSQNESCSRSCTDSSLGRCSCWHSAAALLACGACARACSPSRAYAIVAWATVLTGTFIAYPWYRATPPAGTDLKDPAALVDYPRSLLLAQEKTAGWHNFGMEWKEHVAWIAPFLAAPEAIVVLTALAVLTAQVPRRIRAEEA